MNSAGGGWPTIDHYLRLIFKGVQDPDLQRAQELAHQNVHEPIRASLTAFGRVEVLTEPEEGEPACCYAVSDLESAPADEGSAIVAISTVLPYAAITAPGERADAARYVTENSDDWLGKIAARVAGHGLCLLSGDVCRAISPFTHPSGERLSYYAALFGFQLPTP